MQTENDKLENSKLSRYPKAIVAIHWLTLIVLAVLFWLGNVMKGLDADAEKLQLYRVHVSLGAFLLIITLLRLYFAVRHPAPDEVTGVGGLRLALKKITRVLFYLLLLITPLFGVWALIASNAIDAIFYGDLVALPASRSDYPQLPRGLHAAAVQVILLLLVFHVAASLLATIRHGTQYFRRILP